MPSSFKTATCPDTPNVGMFLFGRHIQGINVSIPIGGSGSLGKTTIQRWIKSNTIINVSRDEEKQWQLRSAIDNDYLTQIIGDISQEEDVNSSILSTKPTIICIVDCLKHIDLCEKFPKKLYFI